MGRVAPSVSLQLKSSISEGCRINFCVVFPPQSFFLQKHEEIPKDIQRTENNHKNTQNQSQLQLFTLLRIELVAHRSNVETGNFLENCHHMREKEAARSLFTEFHGFRLRQRKTDFIRTVIDLQCGGWGQSLSYSEEANVYIKSGGSSENFQAQFPKMAGPKKNLSALGLQQDEN